MIATNGLMGPPEKVNKQTSPVAKTSWGIFFFLLIYCRTGNQLQESHGEPRWNSGNPHSDTIH